MNAMTLMTVALVGWINRQQQEVIEYLREEVRAGIIEPEFGSAGEGEVSCRRRLGGLLSYDYRNAA